MRKFLLLILAAPALFGQTTGTVTQTSQITIKATSGSLYCVFTKYKSSTAFAFRVTCNDKLGYLKNSDSILSEGSADEGSAFRNSDIITWIIQRKQNQIFLSWQIAANGVHAEGTF